MELLSLSTPVSTHSLSSSSYSSSVSSSSSSIKLFRHKPQSLSFLRPHIPPPSSIPKCCSSLDSRLQLISSCKTLAVGGGGGIGLEHPVVSPSMRGGGIAAETGDAMGLLLRERIVFIGSEIDDFNADSVISQLLLLDAQDPKKDIRVFVNSVGGSMSATMAIYDVVKLVRADVSTVAIGISASTASIILAGGTEGKRFAMPNARIMIHQPLGGAGGQVLDVEIQAKELQNSKDNVARIYSEETGRSVDQVLKDIDRDRYMSPIEAVEYGIIDGVIDRDSIIPLVPLPDLVKPRGSLNEAIEDLQKFINPEVPDDEIY